MPLFKNGHKVTISWFTVHNLPKKSKLKTALYIFVFFIQKSKWPLFLHNFWIHLCRTWVTFYLKFIVTGASERSILLCPNALCLNHIVTTTTLVPSSILTRRFSLQAVLCAASVRMSFLNIMSRITQEGRLNEQLSLLHRPVSMSVQDSLKKSTEIKKTQPTVGNTTL